MSDEDNEGLIEYLHNHDDYDKDYILTEGKLKEWIKNIFTTTGNERLLIPKDDYKEYIRFWNKVLDD